MKKYKDTTIIAQSKRLYRIENLVGQIFNKLTVTKLLGINCNGITVWECLCECGKITHVSKTTLNINHKKSCGCSRYKYSDTKDIAINQIFHRYKTSAKKRKLEFELTIDDIESLIFQNCYYCNSSPSNIYATHTNHYKDLLYNGIDRIDNNVGYKNDNILPCCKYCNLMKNNTHVADFALYVDRLAKHYKTWFKKV